MKRLKDINHWQMVASRFQMQKRCFLYEHKINGDARGTWLLQVGDKYFLTSESDIAEALDCYKNGELTEIAL